MTDPVSIRPPAARVHTLGDIARLNGVPVWMVRRLFERGDLAEPARVGRYRVVPDHGLPAVEAALRQAGYLAEACAAG